MVVKEIWKEINLVATGTRYNKQGHSPKTIDYVLTTICLHILPTSITMSA